MPRYVQWPICLLIGEIAQAEMAWFCCTKPVNIEKDHWLTMNSSSLEIHGIKLSKLIWEMWVPEVIDLLDL